MLDTDAYELVEEETRMRRHLYFYTHLERPYARARDVLSGAPGLWLPPPATPGDGYTVTLDAGTILPDGMGRRDAVVRVDPVSPVSDDRSMLRGISWRAADHDELFPVFEGDLELAALSREVCQLSCIGSYRPPLSVVGSVGDRMFGHRVAEAVVRNFVEATAERIAVAVVEV